MKTMCPPGYHHSGFVVTHVLGHIMTTYDHLLYILYILFIMYIYIHIIYFMLMQSSGIHFFWELKWKK